MIVSGVRYRTEEIYQAKFDGAGGLLVALFCLQDFSS